MNEPLRQAVERVRERVEWFAVDAHGTFWPEARVNHAADLRTILAALPVGEEGFRSARDHDLAASGERKPWDHGSYKDAVDFLLENLQAPGEETAFLRCWCEGNLSEWPEFYVWLDKRVGPGNRAVCPGCRAALAEGER